MKNETMLRPSKLLQVKSKKKNNNCLILSNCQCKKNTAYDSKEKFFVQIRLKTA